MTLTATHSTQGRPVRSLRYDLAERPYLVIWEVTRACGLVCTHCRADAVRQRNPLELDTAEAHAMLDDIATFGPPRPVVVLTGGDPLERADLVGLVAHGTAAGLSMALSPSVTPLLTRAALIELRDAGAKAVSLSLDGGTAATHDGFRGVAGVFDATLAAARTVREVGFRLQLNTTVTAGNVRELPQILRFVLELEAALWSVFLLVPTGRGAGLDSLSPDDVEEVLHWLHDVSDHVAIKTTEAPHYRRYVLQHGGDPLAGPQARGEPENAGTGTRKDGSPPPAGTPPKRLHRAPLGVTDGKGVMFVGHLGEIYPAGFLPLLCGRFPQVSVVDTYQKHPTFLALRDPDRFGGICGVCEYHDVCGGSRARAYAVLGDPLGPEPDCVYVPRSKRT